MGIQILIYGLRTNAHSEPCQTSKYFAKNSLRVLFWQMAPS